MTDPESSTGLAPAVAVPLAYVGWWATGLIFWLIERRDPVVRFHAAQAMTAFGALALVLGALSLLTLASLSFVPALFNWLVIVTEGAAVFGVVLWGLSLWRVSRGHEWRIPLAARWAERLSRTS